MPVTGFHQLSLLQLGQYFCQHFSKLQEEKKSAIRKDIEVFRENGIPFKIYFPLTFLWLDVILGSYEEKKMLRAFIFFSDLKQKFTQANGGKWRGTERKRETENVGE